MPYYPHLGGFRTTVENNSTCGLRLYYAFSQLIIVFCILSSHYDGILTHWNWLSLQYQNEHKNVKKRAKGVQKLTAGGLLYGCHERKVRATKSTILPNGKLS